MAVDIEPTGDNIDYTNASSPLNIFAGGGTLMCWIFPRSFGSDNRGFVIGKNDMWRIMMRNNSGEQTIRFRHDFSGSNGSWDFPDDDFITLNTWYHIAITYNKDSTANDPILYRNGESRTVNEASSPGGTAEDDAGVMRIGRRLTSARIFDGLIADVRLYDRILTTNEIQTIYTLRGQDFNLLNLEFWARFKEKHSGQAVVAADIVDYSPNKFSADSVGGTPIYAEDIFSYEFQIV